MLIIPETLLEAITFFRDPAVCLKFVSEIRWEDGPTCGLVRIPGLRFCENTEIEYFPKKYLAKT